MTLAELKNTKGRILGVDFGEARTGLAVSDLSRFLASGLGNVKGGGLSGSAERIVAAAKEQGAVAVALWLYKDAAACKLSPLYWGLIGLFTNLVGLIVYKIYKRSMAVCTGCGAAQPAEHLYCSCCGAALGARCNSCGSKVGAKDSFCHHCGNKIS